MPLSLIQHASDGLHRCAWCGEGDANRDYIDYHDHEWGMPVADERRLYEKITLEGFQAGLSWITVLRKRERFRAVFRDFDFVQVARFTGKDVDRLLLDGGIIRHRGKIEAAINNAQRVCDLLDEQGPGALARLVWQHEPAAAHHHAAQPAPEPSAPASQTAESAALSKALKKRGFRFVGPTTMCAFMQAMGLVNDHLHGCDFRAQVDAARERFVRPV